MDYWKEEEEADYEYTPYSQNMNDKKSMVDDWGTPILPVTPKRVNYKSNKIISSTNFIANKIGTQRAIVEKFVQKAIDHNETMSKKEVFTSICNTKDEYKLYLVSFVDGKLIPVYGMLDTGCSPYVVLGYNCAKKAGIIQFNVGMFGEEPKYNTIIGLSAVLILRVADKDIILTVVGNKYTHKDMYPETKSYFKDEHVLSGYAGIFQNKGIDVLIGFDLMKTLSEYGVNITVTGENPILEKYIPFFSTNNNGITYELINSDGKRKKIKCAIDSGFFISECATFSSTFIIKNADFFNEKDVRIRIKYRNIDKELSVNWKNNDRIGKDIKYDCLFGTSMMKRLAEVRVYPHVLY